MGQVSLRRLEKVYPAARKTAAFRAVKGIDLEIADGEFMVLVGPSGCGKSTTLRMIAGLEEVTAGEIAIDGTVINAVEPKDRGIAMVFQNYALYPHMTVAENMGFALKLAKTPKPEIARRVGEAARTLGLEELLDRKPAALSGGQRQRVAVGRAIVRNPKVFLFDEPLSNLDAKMRVQMRSELSRLHQRLGTTMIYVTHDQVEAMTMGDRICVMKDGEIMQVADPLTLYHSPANTFVASFIGTPPMNLLHGRIEAAVDGTLEFVESASGVNGVSREVREGGEGKGGKVEGSRGGARLALRGAVAERAAKLPAAARGEVIFGVRPEALNDAGAGATSVPLTARIDLVEPMGAETHVHLNTGVSTIAARLHSDARYGEGSDLLVHVDLARAHLFDAATGKVIE